MGGAHASDMTVDSGRRPPCTSAPSAVPSPWKRVSKFQLANPNRTKAHQPHQRGDENRKVVIRNGEADRDSDVGKSLVDCLSSRRCRTSRGSADSAAARLGQLAHAAAVSDCIGRGRESIPDCQARQGRKKVSPDPQPHD